MKILLSALIVSVFIMGTYAQEKAYYSSKTLDVSYEKAIEKLKVALKDQEFGVVSETAMHETINSKVPGSNMDPYIVIGACNAKFADKVIKLEENIGLLLPCKIIVKYLSDNRTEVVVMDPAAVMSVTNNKEVTDFSTDIGKKLIKVLEAL